MRATQPDKARDTCVGVPLTSLESIAGQGVKRATALDGGWCLSAPSFSNLVCHDRLYIPQQIAQVSARPRSAQLTPMAHKLSTETLFSTHKYNQRPGRPVTALPRLQTDDEKQCTQLTNYWAKLLDQNPPVKTSAPRITQVRIGQDPLHQVSPGDRMMRFSQAIPQHVAGNRPASVAGSKPVSVAGSRPASVAGSRPASVVGSRPASVATNRSKLSSRTTSKRHRRTIQSGRSNTRLILDTSARCS